MKRKLIAIALAAMIGFASAAAPNKAEAHGHGGWWIPGAIFGGLALAAIVSRPYYYRPYYYDYGYPYRAAYGPNYYGGPYYYGRPYYRHYRYYRRHYYYH